MKLTLPSGLVAEFQNFTIAHGSCCSSPSLDRQSILTIPLGPETESDHQVGIIRHPNDAECVTCSEHLLVSATCTEALKPHLAEAGLGEGGGNALCRAGT